MLADLWRNNRTAFLIAAMAAFAALGLLAFTVAVGAGGQPATSGSGAAPARSVDAPAEGRLSDSVAPPVGVGSPVPVPGMSSAPSLNAAQQVQVNAARASEAHVLAAYPAVTAATSKRLPPVPAAATSQPLLFAQAFTTRLLSIDFRAQTRTELLSWAQYQSAPMFDDGSGFSAADRAKLLALSLTDPTTTNSGSPVVPTESQWQSLAAQSARWTATNVTANPDPQWEAALASGYQSPDQLTTWVDVSATVTAQVHLGSAVATHRSAVSFRLLLGTSPRGRYGAVAVYGYMSRTVS